jgi:hypothetical protein
MILTIGTLALSALTMGCYTLQPMVGVTPELGVRVAFNINDAGRVGLGGAMGPEIDQIEGRLMERSPEEYLVAVEGVRLLRGGYQVWKGERVRVSSSFVSTSYVRRFSKTRSAILGTVIAGGFLAFMASRGLIGLGDPSDPPTDTSGTDALTRIPIPIRP